MAYVPGFQHDLFVSYAHGDDRGWINRLVDRLRSELPQRLGTEVAIWFDDDQLGRSKDFSREIPDRLKASAVFLLLASPTYIRSDYCGKECGVFQETLPDRRARFGREFDNELFAIRCPIVPIDGNEHWLLFEGLTDIPFCDESDKFLPGSPAFDSSFRRLDAGL